MKRKISLKINGLMCMHCAKRASDALNQVDGVSKVKIDLDAKEATFIYKNDDLEIFKTVISEAGYELVSIEEK